MPKRAMAEDYNHSAIPRSWKTSLGATTHHLVRWDAKSLTTSGVQLPSFAIFVNDLQMNRNVCSCRMNHTNDNCLYLPVFIWDVTTCDSGVLLYSVLLTSLHRHLVQILVNRLRLSLLHGHVTCWLLSLCEKAFLDVFTKDVDLCVFS